MPNGRNNPAINAKRFAALLAGFDIRNSNDNEALANGRALRRMAESAGMRIVDVMELPEVKRAIDDQMQPARTESPALQQALEQAAELREELTGRTRDARKLAELLTQQEEINQKLSRELASARRAAARASFPSSIPTAPAPAVGLPGHEGWMVATATVLALVLLAGAIFGGHFHEGGNSNGPGNGDGISASRVHEDRAVRPLPEHGAVHHRLHRGWPSDRPR